MRSDDVKIKLDRQLDNQQRLPDGEYGGSTIEALAAQESTVFQEDDVRTTETEQDDS